VQTVKRLRSARNGAGGPVNSAPKKSVDHEIVVWDVPTRLFHWSVVLLIAAAYATARLNAMLWHSRIGYALLALLVFRLLWGMFGGETARFSNFLSWPTSALRHLRHALKRGADAWVGHNPAGGWMVLLLLMLMLGQTLSGVYVGNDIADEGPLTEHVSAAIANSIEAMHDSIIWNALLIATGAHVLTIFAYLGIRRDDLITPMIIGRRTVSSDIAQPRLQTWVRALFLFACSIVLTYALVELT
jgi:cytochrome b